MNGVRRLIPAGAAVTALIALASLHGAPRQPVYVGARACAACHTGKGIGNQYGLWLHSKHSRAYAALARPESKEIVEISGLRQVPQEAAICLGCHATAYNAEKWEKDDDFRIEDGVQCEACHGPGSEYMTEAVMRNPEEARKAGLRIPDDRFCLGCHVEKGSHVAVLKAPKLEKKKAWADIAHPRPGTGTVKVTGKPPDFPVPPEAQKAAHKYIGAAQCGSCHKGEAMGHQYSVWRMSAHARAWSVLSTPAAYAQAARKGIVGDPQRAPECLKCHSTGYGAAHTASSKVDEGVTCEACHGPGSDYAFEAVMHDKRGAIQAGLKTPTRETCLGCHGTKFDTAAGMKAIAHPSKPPVATNGRHEVRYKNPLNMALRPGGKELWVTCEAADSVIVVDTAARKSVAEIPVGGMPIEVAFAPGGKLAFVSNRHDDTVSVIDTGSRKIVKTLATGDEPHGVLTDRQGKYLYVANTSSGDVSVFDIASLTYVKTLSASRGPWSLALSPDGAVMLLTNMLARFSPLRTPFASELTSIDAERGTVDERRVVDGANMMMGVDWHPSGKFALATLNRTKSLVPMTRLMQGWTITNGLAIMWRDGAVDQVLLDEPNMGFADPSDVACTPDGRYALVTSAGTDRVAVVDIAKLTAALGRATKHEREHVIPNHQGYPTEFVLKHIDVKNNPRGVLVAPDGSEAYVANSLDDSLSVIDLKRLEAVARIDLGGSREITRYRQGERLFHNARITFRHQHSCASCHPDGHIDSVTYDIESDGIGISPVDNRTLRGILDTAPFKWEGTNPSLSRQCGARLSVFFTRLLPFTPEELAAVDRYVTAIERPPNRYRSLGAPLNPAQRRGKAVFGRTMTNDGRTIPIENRCITCHFPPYFTDRQLHDVGTRMPADRQGKFDAPHLNNIYDSAPYLHNGMAATLEEIWTVYNPDDRHGVTNDMTKDQLNELVEYLKTL
ncbi:MAG TPA: multiheme c-type cytochrome [Bryobacteraceae bacterium]|nr:multiheme c-type cytochrome [Bryobacteraceae bacterium]